MLLISAHSLAMLYISAKSHEIILNGIKVIERTQFLYRKLLRGIIPQKSRWSDRCLSLHILWSCFFSTKFCEIISNSIKVIEGTRFLY